MDEIKSRIDEALELSKLSSKVNELIKRKDEEECSPSNILIWVLAIIGAVAAVAAIAYLVYRYMTPAYTDDFDDDFDDDIEYDFTDDDDEEETEVKKD